MVPNVMILAHTALFMVPERYGYILAFPIWLPFKDCVLVG